MVSIILANGFEPLEAVAPCDILRRGGADVRFASVEGNFVEGGHGIVVHADCLLDDLEAEKQEMVVIPGGWGGVCNILESPKALEFIKTAYDSGAYVAAICAGPIVLANLGITDGKKATCYPGLEDQMGKALMQDEGAVRDGRIITGRAAGTAEAFGLLLLQALKGQQAAQKVAQSIVYSR